MQKLFPIIYAFSCLISADLFAGNATSATETPAITWALTQSTHGLRVQNTATLLPDGQVLVAGGNLGSVGSYAELYNPVTGTWKKTQPLGYGVLAHTATLLQDGRVLVAGGVTEEGETARAELYDPASKTWTRTGDLNFARA